MTLREMEARAREDLRRAAAPEIESRVLAAVLTEPDKLAIADDLEVADFVDYRHQAIFAAVRELQVTASPIGVLEVADQIAMRDLERAKHVSDTIGAHFIARIVGSSPRYEDALGPDSAIGVFEADLRQLRKIAKAREAA